MTPPYEPHEWVDDDGSGEVGTLVSAERMNHIEQGIANAGGTAVFEQMEEPVTDEIGAIWIRQEPI